VPIDVRVVDVSGQPVRGLSTDDFEVFEDGRRQQIAHVTPLDVDAATADTPEGEAVSTGRTFLIVLGRGDLQGPVRGLTALREFLRERLRPNDRVGLLAYKRVTDFLTDGDAIARLLEHYERQYRDVENRLNLWFIARNIETRIDKLFSAPGLPPTRQLPHRFGPTDTGQLRLGLEHLRRIEGEKHLIFVSERALGGPVAAASAKDAADRRIVASVIVTGGTKSRMQQPSGAKGGSVTFHARSFNDLDRELDWREFAEHTGGQAFLYAHGDEALDQIERASRSRYLVGYYPDGNVGDDTYRQISVKVRRTGVIAHYRHGYFAGSREAMPETSDDIADERIASAAAALRPPHDIRLSGIATSVADPEGRPAVRVDLTIDPSSIGATHDGARQVLLEVRIFVGDRREDVIGELSERIDLRQSLNQRTTPISWTGLIRTTGTPRYVKAVVYESASDRAGVLLIDRVPK